MARKCVIKNCANSLTMKQKCLIFGVMFHKFPSHMVRRNEWIHNIQTLANQKDFIPREAVICSDHFDKNMYILKAYGKKRLVDEAKPTIFFTAKIEKSYSEIECLETSGPTELFGHKRAISDGEDSLMFKRCKRNYVNVAVNRNEMGPEHISQSVDENQSCMKTTARVTAQNSEPPSRSLTFWLENQKIKPKLLRYPGDINVNDLIHQLIAGVSLCQKKINDQAKVILALKRKLKTKNSQIATLRVLVKDLKKKFALSEKRY